MRDTTGREAMMATAEDETLELVSPEEADGERLDRWLTGRVGTLSRSRLQALIKAGKVRVAGKVVTDPGYRVAAGAEIAVSVPPPEPAVPVGEEIPLTVVFEDKHVIVVDKPAGLVVHPAAGHATGTLVNALIAHCGDSLSGIGGVKRPGIVHRLDKDTSGLLVVAKSDAAHAGLSEQFAAHGEDGRLQRAYLALVWGVPERRRGRIDAALARSTANRTKIAVTRGESGRHAVTHYEVIETFATKAGKPLASLVRLVLETGRTHQIRVHLAYIGHPVMGDQTYGAGFAASTRKLGAEAREALDVLGRQALHAAELGFEHPVTGRPQRFTSMLPADIERLTEALRACR